MGDFLEPKQIKDPSKSKPKDWVDEEDGEWEAPLIDNPEYKGPWKPKMIKNPAYKGSWVHPLIDNPDFVDDKTVYNACKDCLYVGIEIWQVKAGSIFDDIIITDSVEEAKTFLAETHSVKAPVEKAAKEAADKKAREEEEAAQEEEKDDEEDEDEDDEDWEEDAVENKDEL